MEKRLAQGAFFHGFQRRIAGKCIEYCFSYDHDPEGRRRLMRAVIELLAKGAIRPAVGARFKLGEVRLAHALLEAGTALGKIVMHP